MNNQEYWKDRALLLEEKLNSYGIDAYREIEETFDKAQIEIQADIEKWYNRIAKNNNLSMAQARDLLNKNQLKEFHWTVDEYIKYGKENALNQNWIKELENASAKWHISKLEALKISTQQSLEKAFGNYLGDVDSMMKKVYTEGYNRSIFNIQKGYGVGFDIGTINEKSLAKLISKPWADDGRNFSDRIWAYKSDMVNGLHKALTNTCIQGLSPDKAIKELTQYVDPKIKNNKYCASRIVMTEQAFIASASQEQAFNDLGVEEFEIVATLDSKTSNICRDMDGKHFPMADYVVGVTAPPFHPNCRSVTCPYFNDEFTLNDTRIARDEAGKTYKLPADMSYRDWEKHFVDGGTKDDLIELTKKDDLIELTKKAVSSIISSKVISRPTDCKNFEELNDYMESKFNITIPDEIKKLDYECVAKSIDGIDLVINEFPKAKYKFNGIKIGNSGVMSASLNGNISFNSNYYNNINNLSDVIIGNVTGFHPKNNGIIERGSHEMGHLLESVLIEHSQNNINKVKQWNECYQAKILVSQACKNAKKIQKGILNKELMSNISEYATHDSSECLAEAVADFIANGENASLLSKEIWKILKQKIGEI